MNYRRLPCRDCRELAKRHGWDDRCPHTWANYLADPAFCVMIVAATIPVAFGLFLLVVSIALALRRTT